MWNIPTKERLDKIAKLYETEHTLFENKIIHLHFFIGGCDWFICEDDGQDTFFGFCVLNNHLEFTKWGLGFESSVCKITTLLLKRDLVFNENLMNTIG